MSFTVGTAANGMRIGRWDDPAKSREQPAAQAAQSTFFAELSRAAQTAAKAEASGDVDLKTGYDRLSAQSKALLNRLKEMTASKEETEDIPEEALAGISTDEWRALRKDMLDAGLISKADYFHSDPDIVIIGYSDANGDTVFYPPFNGYLTSAQTGPGGSLWSSSSDSVGWISRLGAADWTGDPFQFLDQWLKRMRSWQYDLDLLVRPNGVKYDTSHLTKQMEDRQKVTGLVKDLMELA